MENDDIKDVMAEERGRGKRRVDTEALKARAKMRRDMRYLLSIRKREDFIENLIRLGVKPGSPEYELALQIWRGVYGA